MQEIKLIDNLLNGRGHLPEIVNDDGSVATMETKTSILDNVEDSLHAEANDALAVE